jgi:hypothetical protein
MESLWNGKILTISYRLEVDASCILLTGIKILGDKMAVDFYNVGTLVV